MSETTHHDPALFLNRELSWLAFNERVLAEARDEAVPLFERVKFASIVASNLDEFFMVRIASLKRQAESGNHGPDPAGMSPDEQLHRARAGSTALMGALYALTMGTLIPALSAHGVRLLAWADLLPLEQASIAAFFRDDILPVLTPLAIDASRPFPLLASLTINLALLIEPVSDDSAPLLAIAQVPPGLTRLVRVPGRSTPSFVPLEDVIRACLSQLFPGQTIREARCIRLSRDAELELDDEGTRTQIEVVEQQLKQRRRSDVARLEIEAAASSELIDLLRTRLHVDLEDIFPADGPLDLRLLMSLTEGPGHETLREPPAIPVAPLPDEARGLFAVLDERDLLLHHPYESFDPVLALVAQAAEDPEVLAIKQTLYRVSAGSPVIASLQHAAERNKQVTVLVELTARFDEERNIRWARSLEEAGAHVIYGVRRYKTHAKVCLVVRRTAEGIRRYVHLGTGNYNERTARLYTDFSFMTSSAAICADVSAVFNALTGYGDPPHLKQLAMAPTGLRKRFLRLILREQRLAAAGHKAEITAKMNSLLDEEIIEALYAASRAGVRIRLNVRGICALRPSVTGSSETIEVVSIVDRFLEHSRIYYFHNGGDEEVYLASADWMTRNLDRRVELLFPVRTPEHRRRLISVLDLMFRDTAKAWRLLPDGTYDRIRPPHGELPFRVQQHLQDDAQRGAAMQDRIGEAFQPR